MPAMDDGEVVVARAVRIAQAARMLDVPVRATEQYPAGLGPTVAPLKPYPGAVLAKTRFSALDDPDFPALLPIGSSEVIIAGEREVGRAVVVGHAGSLRRSHACYQPPARRAASRP